MGGFMVTGRKWVSKAALYLCDWLNILDPRLADVQREVAGILDVLRGGVDPAKVLAVLQRYQPLPARWMLVAGGVRYILAPDGQRISELYHVLYDADEKQPAMLDFMPSSMDPFQDGFYLLARASQGDALRRVTKCKRCDRWFIARRDAQAYCSPSCQRTFWEDFAKTDEGKEIARRKMEVYRAKLRKKAKGRKRR
jgi:hypothetical protein